MRDPKRIEPMLELIRRIWVNSPDLRLTQLIVAAARTGVPCPELFYLEDDKLHAKLGDLAREFAIPDASSSPVGNGFAESSSPQRGGGK